MKSKALLLLAFSFLVIGTVAYYIQKQPVSQNTFADRISNALEAEIKALETDANNFLERQPACAQDVQTKFPFYVFRGEQLTCWTDNSFLPPVALVSDTFSIQLFKTAKSSFLLYQKPISNGGQLVSLVMLTRGYPIQNSFLEDTWNKSILPTSKIFVLEPESSIGVPVYLNNAIVFRVSLDINEAKEKDLLITLSVIFIMLGIMLFMIYLYRQLVRNYNTKGLILFCCTLFFIRVLLLFFGYPRSIVSATLFSSDFYASSILNPSLGDLLLNVLVVFVLSLLIFLWYRSKSVVISNRNTNTNQILVSVLFSFLFFCTIHFPVATIQTITHNSALQLAITESLEFSSPRVVAFAIVLLCWASAFLLSHVFLKYVFTNTKGYVYLVLILGGVVFSAINWWEEQYFLHTLAIAFTIVVVVYYFKLIDSLDRFQYRTVSYLLVVLFGFTLHAGISVYTLTKEQQVKDQFRFAESFLLDGDSFAEFLLGDVFKKISRDVFIQTRLTSPLLSKEPVEQKIRQVHLPSYFNKYNVRVLLFNTRGRSINKEDTTSFSQLLNSYTPKYERTEYAGLYKRMNSSSGLSQQYLLVVPVQRNQNLAGYVVIDIAIKSTLPQNTYPDLLVDNRFQESLRPSKLNYATFSGNSVILQSGDFNYEQKFDTVLFANAELFKTGIAINGFQHVALRNSESYVTVVTGKLMTRTFILANVFFYFILGLFVVLSILIVVGVSNFLNNRPLYYAARIQLLVSVAFFIPLLIVSIVTLRLLSESSLQQLNSMYKSKSLLLADQLSEESQSDSLSNFYSRFLELSRLSNTECSLYDSTGKLLITSQPLLVENQLMTPIINPIALQKFEQGQASFSVPDRIGNLLYFVSYTRLRSSNTLLAVPYYQSASALESIQIKVLADILALFGVVFLILLLFSYSLARWLVSPLKFVAQSLQQTSLDKTNKLLEWRANDEIGLLVNSYNSMLQKLESNKLELSKMQRESAWREIAQQVAHEIKNPLTPMKLSLQRLERAFTLNPPTTEQMKHSIASMLEQVAALNSIASSFSAFAALPAPSLQRVDGIEILKKCIDVYTQENIELITNQTSAHTLTDPVLLQGVFSNLIINSLQAAQEDVSLQLRIRVERIEDRWLFRFSDNGMGIDPSQHEKIFLPHFTTKNSGSGLGLAIARQSIERMNGSLSFTSVVNEGTTFTVALPIV